MKRWIALLFLGVAMTARIAALHSSFLIEDNIVSPEISKITHSSSTPLVVLPEELKERIRLSSTRKSTDSRSEIPEIPLTASPFALPKEKEAEISLRESEEDESFC